MESSGVREALPRILSLGNLIQPHRCPDHHQHLTQRRGWTVKNQSSPPIAALSLLAASASCFRSLRYPTVVTKQFRPPVMLVLLPLGSHRVRRTLSNQGLSKRCADIAETNPGTFAAFATQWRAKRVRRNAEPGNACNGAGLCFQPSASPCTSDLRIAAAMRRMSKPDSSINASHGGTPQCIPLREWLSGATPRL